MIKDLPIEENPREKALINGLTSLTNIELLALLLRTGNKQKSVLELSTEVINTAGGMSQMRYLNYNQLTAINGIKKAKAIELLAAIELGKRVISEKTLTFTVENPGDVYHFLKSDLMLETQEHFVILILNCRHELIKKQTLFIGTADCSLVSTRDIYKAALNVNGVAIICVHNHPSGKASPSDNDYLITKNLEESSTIMHIEFIDHIIIGMHEYFSFKAGRVFSVAE